MDISTRLNFILLRLGFGASDEIEPDGELWDPGCSVRDEEDVPDC